MKLLLDENLSRRIVPFIQGLYPNSTQVALTGLEQSDDKTIRQYAVDNDFVIVTKDADYYDMTALYGQPPKIIWLKTGNQSKAATIKTLQAKLALLKYTQIYCYALRDFNNCQLISSFHPSS